MYYHVILFLLYLQYYPLLHIVDALQASPPCTLRASWIPSEQPSLIRTCPLPFSAAPDSDAGIEGY